MTKPVTSASFTKIIFALFVTVLSTLVFAAIKMNETAFFAFKLIVSALVITGASWLSGKKPILAGFLIALPLMSILAILFSYLQYRDMNKVNQFADSIFAAVPLSLCFFVPFLLNRWLKMNFVMTFGAGLLFLVAAYFIHALIFQPK